MTKNNVFKIVAAGEDPAAVRRAQALVKRLAVALEPELQISNDIWKFEMLDKSQARKEAANRAANADMIIIAASGESEPPAHVKSWIESWLPRKWKGVTALVALLDPAEDVLHESLPLSAYLRRLAGEWGMDFFSNSANWWQQYLESTPEVPYRPEREIPQREMSESANPVHVWRHPALNG